MKFKVGDKVRVIRKSIGSEIFWNSTMNKTIGKVYTVLEITSMKNLILDTEKDISLHFAYPPKGVEKVVIKNQQLLFDFMTP